MVFCLVQRITSPGGSKGSGCWSLFQESHFFMLGKWPHNTWVCTEFKGLLSLAGSYFWLEIATLQGRTVGSVCSSHMLWCLRNAGKVLNARVSPFLFPYENLSSNKRKGWHVFEDLTIKWGYDYRLETQCVGHEVLEETPVYVNCLFYFLVSQDNCPL